MSKPKAFKPVFDGYFKIYLHDDDYRKQRIEQILPVNGLNQSATGL